MGLRSRIRGRHGKDALAQFGIDHKQARGIVFGQFQALDDRVCTGLFFHLLSNKPLQEDIAGMIFFLDGQIHQVIDKRGHMLLVFKYFFESCQG